jgi:ABC-2 type transport system ATP-binding protein
MVIAGAGSGPASGPEGEPESAPPAVVLEGVVKRYGGRTVLHDLSFSVRRGEVFAVLGPNGAGKTTAVELLEGYRVPDAGRLRVLGLDPIADGAALKPRIGLMLQGGGIYPQIRPLEALRLFAAFYARPEDPAALLRATGLEDAAGTRYRQLSGGQKQRLSLALALVGRPELVFLDEPTAAMDPLARRATWDVIRGLKARGVTVLLTTHYLDEAERLADRIAVVDAGRLVALDSPAALMARAGGPALRFSAPPGLDTAALGAALAAGGRAGSSNGAGGARPEVREVEPGRYAVAGAPSPVLVARLTAWLAAREAQLTELSVGRRSLEDVYLELTGVPAELAAGASPGAPGAPGAPGR